MTLPDSPAPPESLWPARLVIVAVIGLNLALSEQLTFGPTWLLPSLELLLLLPLSFLRGRERWRVHRLGQPPVALFRLTRWLALGLIGLLHFTNLASLVLLILSLLSGQGTSGVNLLAGALNIWVTNVLVFSLWYWELDQGGPLFRRRCGQPLDFLFPQTNAPALAPAWRPEYLDYLFVAFTNAAAFSPTDTMPLTRRIKLLMTIQSATSMLTVVLVASRAVNILK
ncbi:DUF1345 domain-containing protein (plasmid) [Deinococcus metallilatus]|uniref:DUF1345 domain-containing protein n=1 Tax=Deinococcus metallilatus TaxID=1211322 RepID=A0ABR6MZ84_9DEIO|nr:DUF1345 domain-containing protein [Deinococcus metallilatus]MBB5296979.1 hypothetical protein [Deinococcus metallilatus]QBY06655.1 DUF1345 domain-containing protein [Deinococcus metallilatus]GMA15122.1 hypothetical protein GCM10025871_14530 [Deinococcus metallilatus]